ncbi:hypothetical protein DU508_14090 [Pedobacter chinensis]|uniref:Uncharacterized protein n=1 Tax=Pedobacter chinensis TaxID=2282421 RepID=A0A369PTJ5_9SPHI|nr:hypothetical protein [Pedobacter chinensis]RDC55981.1 hypothetical protein DU508_14090 [Pedobacter chinensis]
MKTKLIILAAALSFTLAACSGNRADGSDQDSTYVESDSAGLLRDSTARDSVGAKEYGDSTSNAPRIIGK